MAAISPLGDYSLMDPHKRGRKGLQNRDRTRLVHFLSAKVRDRIRGIKKFQFLLMLLVCASILAFQVRMKPIKHYVGFSYWSFHLKYALKTNISCQNLSPFCAQHLDIMFPNGYLFRLWLCHCTYYMRKQDTLSCLN